VKKRAREKKKKKKKKKKRKRERERERESNRRDRTRINMSGARFLNIQIIGVRLCPGSPPRGNYRPP
jgi:hypothetical protein